MRQPVRIPQAGTADEAVLTEWSVTVGDPVESGQVIGTAETDKVTLEIVAPCAGTIAELPIAPGDEVAISEPVAWIDAAQAPAAALADDAVAAAPVESIGTAMDTDAASRVKATAAGAEPPGSPAPARFDSGSGGRVVARGIELLPLSPVRRRIAENMQWVAQNTVRASTTIEADFERVAQIRSKLGEAFRRNAGFSLTPLPFVARAVCATLPSFPDLQSVIDLERGQLAVHRKVNLGIAVADEGGLRVPVIHDAAGLDLTALAMEIRRRIEGVRTGTLRADDSQGGTFTITNPGALGAVMSAPVMNRGETSILSLDAVEPRPVVDHGRIVVRQRSYLTLAFDHRVVDGSTAIAFLKAIDVFLGSDLLAGEAERLAEVGAA